MSAAPRLEEAVRGKRIVFLNWRDLDHPQAGGAELYVHALAAQLAAAGAQVVELTSRPAGLPARATRDGVSIVRKGGTFTVYLWALWWLLRRSRKLDAVVDSQNGIPFFSPLVLPRRTPTLCVIHHVHQDQFASYFGRAMTAVGKFLEGPVSRFVYGRRAVIAVSPSTRADVRARLRLRGPIHLVPNGADLPQAGDRDRSANPSIVSVGRLVPHKRLELLIGALPEILDGQPELTVDIVGDGPEAARLKALAERLGVGAAITWHGRVSDRRRDELISAAWLAVIPSAGEGWGLTVLECNVHGVPALAFRVRGLRDSVIPGETGWLLDEDDSLDAAVLHALGELESAETAEGWSSAARAWASRFTWDESAHRLSAALVAESDRLRFRGTKHDRRVANDMSTRVEIHVDDRAETPDPPRSARRTDSWTREGEWSVGVLHGADEEGAAKLFARSGGAGHARAEVARPSHLLFETSGSPARSSREPASGSEPRHQAADD